MSNPMVQPTGPVLVLGAAGTGKTTLLVEAVAGRIRAAERPALVLALTRQAASELRDRIVRAAGRTTLAPQVMTVHALCLTLVARFAAPDDAGPGLLTAPEQEFRIRELLRSSPAPWPAELDAALGTRAFAQQVRAVLARARQLGLDPEDLSGAGAASGEFGWAAVGAFMGEYLDVLDAEGVIDYAELVHRARLLLEQEGVLEAVRAEYAVVLVDDWCELDAAQIGLVRALAGDAVPVVALADPDTAIYRFRGAHPRATAEFVRLFPGARVVTLPHAHRQPPAQVAACTAVARRLGAPAVEREALAAYRGVTGGGAGRVEVRTFPDEATHARHLAAELRAAHLDDQVPWGDMAVLVRAGRTQLPPLARALIDAGIPVEVAGDEIGLASELAVRPLLLGLEVAGAGGQPDGDQATRLLLSGWGGYDAVGLRAVGRRLRAADPAAAGAPTETLVAEALAGVRAVPEADEELAARRDLLARATALVAREQRPEAVLWELWSGTGWPERLRADAVRGGDASARAHHDLDAVCALFDLARTSQGPGGQPGVSWFAAEVAQQQIPADSQRESAVGGRGVRLLTAHRAKGRHWSLVVVAGVQEGIWPDVRRRGSVFDPQRLGASEAGPELALGLTTRDLVATERRLFLLACSRAEGRLIVTAVEGTEGEEDRPSRFLAELGVPPRHLVSTPPALHTLRQLVAELRRTAQDDAASPALREAAAARLAVLADATDDEGFALAPDADPARWWGVHEPTSTVAPAREGPIRLSPSQVESLLTCPRKYFLSREARAEPPREIRTILGSVIHAVAERAASGELAPDDVAAALDAVWASIPFPAAWLSASERAEADAAVRRFLNWQAGHDHADLVGVEVPFSADVTVNGRPVQLVGAVDRLERRSDGALKVVDFKTGRSAPTQKAAEVTPQIGVYQLAIEAGGFRDAGTTSAGASLVYLRVEDGEGWPKEFRQPSLTEKPHLTDDPEELAHPTWVHHQVARACAVLEAGRFDAQAGEHCTYCPVRSSCPARSGQVIA
ncbi:ATP-dependent helicase [Propioniciclava soli]|uniref:ATP-dependent helicase n=1 Tax=Propioniciclava soli TaxID=2775081 RepID=UPI001E514CB5